ncbi:hypothetical protein LCGC14_0350000 [marine sediment metagenome]|uniref:Uncharacterized protein n=1 Tax=marine sediment metagenome TaxID=412755 RepID=A0A0F9WJ54_9ZZZZ
MLTKEQFMKMYNTIYADGATQGYELRDLMAKVEKRNREYTPRLTQELEQILKDKSIT